MLIEQGALFFYDFGPRQNRLQEGKRPAVVIQADILNRLPGYANVIILPVTSKERSSPTFVPIQPGGSNALTMPSWAIANQIFTVDRSTLGEPLGTVSKSELFAIKEAVRLVLGIGA